MYHRIPVILDKESAGKSLDQAQSTASMKKLLKPTDEIIVGKVDAQEPLIARLMLNTTHTG